MTCAMCNAGFPKSTHLEPSFRCAHHGCGRLCVKVVNGAIHQTSEMIAHEPARP